MQNESWNVESKDGDSSKDTGSGAATPAKWKCRNCGVENVNVHKFCDNCGTPANEDLTIDCPNCGAKLKYGALTCEACDIYPLLDCPRCGAKVKPDAQFCGACGAPLREKSLSGIMSIVFAIATIGMGIALRDCREPKMLELLKNLLLIFCCLSVGSGCVALGKGRGSGLIGIVLLFLYAVGGGCGSAPETPAEATPASAVIQLQTSGRGTAEAHADGRGITPPAPSDRSDRSDKSDKR